VIPSGVQHQAVMDVAGLGLVRLAPKSKKSRKITRTAYYTHCRRVPARQQCRSERRMRSLGQRTIEPAFGSLLRLRAAPREHARV
jgi:hypothetical protein